MAERRRPGPRRARVRRAVAHAGDGEREERGGPVAGRLDEAVRGRVELGRRRQRRRSARARRTPSRRRGSARRRAARGAASGDLARWLGMDGTRSPRRRRPGRSCAPSTRWQSCVRASRREPGAPARARRGPSRARCGRTSSVRSLGPCSRWTSVSTPGTRPLCPGQLAVQQPAHQLPRGAQRRGSNPEPARALRRSRARGGRRGARARESAERTRLVAALDLGLPDLRGLDSQRAHARRGRRSRGRRSGGRHRGVLRARARAPLRRPRRREGRGSTRAVAARRAHAASGRVDRSRARDGGAVILRVLPVIDGRVCRLAACGSDAPARLRRGRERVQVHCEAPQTPDRRGDGVAARTGPASAGRRPAPGLAGGGPNRAGPRARRTGHPRRATSSPRWTTRIRATPFRQADAAARSGAGGGCERPGDARSNGGARRARDRRSPGARRRDGQGRRGQGERGGRRRVGGPRAPNARPRGVRSSLGGDRHASVARPGALVDGTAATPVAQLAATSRRPSSSPP